MNLNISGFYIPGAIWLSIGIIVPLLLHIRFKKKVVKQIPSIHLFFLSRKKRRRFWLENLLLLISRMLFLACLSLLLMQPYFLTLDRLPFYDLTGGIEQGPSLAILIDDSIDSKHKLNGKTRLSLQKEWLGKQIASIPDNSKITIASTSFPQTSPWLNPKEAKEYISSIFDTSEISKNASTALERLFKKIAGKRGAILVAGPMTSNQWQEANQNFMNPLAIPLYFFDSRKTKTPAWIENVEPYKSTHSLENSATFEVMIKGITDDMNDLELGIYQSKQLLTRKPILNTSQKDTTTLRFSVPVLNSISTLSVKLINHAESFLPWNEWFFLSKAGKMKPYKKLVILGRGEKPSQEEQIMLHMMGALEATHQLPRFDLLSVDPTALGNAGKIILMGSHDIPKEIGEWIQSMTILGAKVVVIPLDTITNSKKQDYDFLPLYYPYSNSSPSSRLPLYINTNIDNETLESLVPYELLNMSTSTLMPPQWPDENFNNILVTKTNEPIISQKLVGTQGIVFALSTPFVLEQNSVIYNPLMPLLINKLLTTERSSFQKMGKSTTTFAYTNLGDWLTEAMLDGTLTDPIGRNQHISADPGTPFNIQLQQPGIYRYQDPNREIFATVNDPRPLIENHLEPDQWQARYPLFKPEIVNIDRILQDNDFDYISEDKTKIEKHQYDLSILAAYALILFGILEIIFLTLTWLRVKKGVLA